jgi:hypothetical protein
VGTSVKAMVERVAGYGGLLHNNNILYQRSHSITMQQ